MKAAGCLIAVRNDLISKRVTEFELMNDVWVSVDREDGFKTFFNVRYVEIGTKLHEYTHMSVR